MIYGSSNVVLIFIPGILSNPEDVFGWTDKGCRDGQRHGFLVDKYEYLALPILRPFKQDARSDRVGKLVDAWNGSKIVIVAHSNGCELTSRFLKKFNHYIHQIHFIAGANDSNCDRNGINDALLEDRVGDVFIYSSINDEALRKGAKRWTSWLQFIGLNYGWLGLYGPANIDPRVLGRIHIINDNSQVHRSWLGDNYEKTMGMVLSYASTLKTS